MQHSEQPYIELERARKAIEAMRQAKSLADVEEHWKEYLRRLERAWNKAENHFRKSPKWDSWNGKFKTLRRKDDLLAYLVNARGADEHTIADITEVEAGGLFLRPDKNGVVHVKKMQIENNRVVHAEFGTGSIEFTPARLRLLPVQNRGVTYDVPQIHLSKSITGLDPVEIAELGIAFYAEFLDAAERYFIAPVRAPS